MSASGGSLGPWGLISRARNFGSIGAIITAAVGGIMLAIPQEAIRAFQALVSVFVEPVQSLAGGAAGIVTAFLGGISSIIRQGAETTVATLAPQATWAVGPLTFGFSVAAAGGGLFVMALLLEQGPTSDAIPGTFTDFPLIGTDEEDEEQ